MSHDVQIGATWLQLSAYIRLLPAVQMVTPTSPVAFWDSISLGPGAPPPIIPPPSSVGLMTAAPSTSAVANGGSAQDGPARVSVDAIVCVENVRCPVYLQGSYFDADAQYICNFIGAGNRSELDCLYLILYLH